jgi:hypothetical protein
MTLDLLDLLLVSAFCFDKTVPWWLWVLGVVASIGGGMRMEKITKALGRA